MFKIQLYGILLALIYSITAEARTYLKLTSSGPAVIGSQVNFTAELFENDQPAKKDDYLFIWSDNASPKHENTTETHLPILNWSITYPKNVYKAGKLSMRVEIQQKTFFWFHRAEAKIDFELHELLKGNLSLYQNGTERQTNYVSNLTPVTHSIKLIDSDFNYLMNNTTYITTYWFQNCVYMGQTNGLTYTNFYTKENEEYEIEALVIGSFDKLPEPITSTTTTTTPATTSTAVPTTSSSSTTTTTTTMKSLAVSSTTKPTTKNPVNISNVNSSDTTENSQISAAPKRMKRAAANVEKGTNKTDNRSEVEVSPYGIEIDVKNFTKQLNDGLINASQLAAVMSQPETIENGTTSTVTTEIIPNYHNQPFVCFNKSQIAPDPNKTYGYFQRKVIVKVPIANLTITGSNWLKFGDVLNLKVKCVGSPPLDYCVKIFPGPYNVTGNETCLIWQQLQSCDLPFTHYFQFSTMHSVVFVIRNPVVKVVNQVAVNFYEAKKQSQLSVIVVPVSFSLVAVILVVFGVAYYIQNRNRYIVEVADFNFGETSSVDMEYKTFQQRLFDSIRDVIHRPRRNLDGRSSPSGESSLKYGSMT